MKQHMKLSHIHEDKTLDPSIQGPSYGETLTDYLNSFKIYPNAYRHEERFDIVLKIWNRGGDRPISLTKNGPFKTIGYEQVKYEPEPTPEPNNPLDNPLDNIGKNTFEEDNFTMWAAVVEGANKFEGQFAWYNEDLMSGDSIPRRTQTTRWEEGKLPKFPRELDRWWT